MFLYLKYIFDRKNYQIYKLNQTAQVDNSKPNNFDNKVFEDLAKDLQNLKEQVQNNVTLVETNLKTEINKHFESLSKITTLKFDNVNQITKDQIQSLKEISEKNLANTKDSFEKEIKYFSTNIKESLDKNGNSLNDIKHLFNNNKLRGNVGEGYLEAILTDNLGFGDNALWKKQYKFKNDKQVDFVITHPNLKKVIPIDCKFPLEKIKPILYNENIDSKDPILKDIKKDINKMIDDIKRKYINPETTDFALMFIPSEGIYNFLLTNLNDVFVNSFKQLVYICSPTNFLAIVSVFLAATNKIQLYENLKPAMEKIGIIQKDYERLYDRWNRHIKDFDKVHDSVKQLDISFNKIFKQSEQLVIDNQKNNAKLTVNNSALLE